MIKSKEERKAEHNKSVLRVLEALRVCSNGGFSPGFAYRKTAGICWHVFSQTVESTINLSELTHVFETMGLDSEYPVEMQKVSSHGDAARLYRNSPNHYDADTFTGAARLKLLDDLIQYYQNLI